MTSPTRQALIDALFAFGRAILIDESRELAAAVVDKLDAHFLSEAASLRPMRVITCLCTMPAYEQADIPGHYVCSDGHLTRDPEAEGAKKTSDRTDAASDAHGLIASLGDTTPARGSEGAGTISPASLQSSSSSNGDETSPPLHGPADGSACPVCGKCEWWGSKCDACGYLMSSAKSDEWAPIPRPPSVTLTREQSEQLLRGSVSAKGDEELGKIACGAYFSGENRWSGEMNVLNRIDWIRAASAVRAAVEEGMRPTVAPPDWEGMFRVERDRANQAEARARELKAELSRTRVKYQAEGNAEMRERAATLIEDIGDGLPYPLQAKRIRALPLTAPPAPAAEPLPPKGSDCDG